MKWVSLGSNPGVIWAALLLEALRTESISCLYHLLEAFLGSWSLPAPSRPAAQRFQHLSLSLCLSLFLYLSVSVSLPASPLLLTSHLLPVSESPPSYKDAVIALGPRRSTRFISASEDP